MVITYHGNGGFRMQSGAFVIAVDPAKKIKADIIIYTEAAPSDTDISAEGSFIISNPGEYEIKGSEVRGWPGLYLLNAEEMRLLLFGVQFEKFGEGTEQYLSNIDIVIVPPATRFADALREIKPSIVITHSEGKDAKQFLAEMGQKDAKPQEKLVVKKKDLTPEAMGVHVLNI